MTRRLFDILARQLRAQGRMRRSLLLVAAAGAATSAVFANMWSPPANTPAWMIGVHIAALVLFGVIPLLVAIAETTPADLVEELGREITARETAEHDSKMADWKQDAVAQAFRRSVVLYETARAISEATDAVMLAPPETRAPVADRQMRAVLDLLIENKVILFGIEDDHWTFGIYVLDGDRLRMRVARRWSPDDADKPHRDWAPGEGHVGQAFRIARELVCSDSSDPNVSGFLSAAGDNIRAYDDQLYVSFASVPIMIGARERPLGVLVATSDRRGRFTPSGDADQGPDTPDTVEPLRVAADVIASILFLTDSPAPAFPC